ncbi:hypothetical protein GCM10007387_05260 [Pseudoduganella albidiflava]|uniref:Uncharacterized protein n=1 Tax=Pseudoduganella albidiflava TaxID=321983 RepID=A0AA87XPH8_9BURK|nr:hypothetical protein GCM10007387_05260 [Pseudoduganella albidiflava]
MSADRLELPPDQIELPPAVYQGFALDQVTACAILMCQIDTRVRYIAAGFDGLEFYQVAFDGGFLLQRRQGSHDKFLLGLTGTVAVTWLIH